MSEILLGAVCLSVRNTVGLSDKSFCEILEFHWICTIKLSSVVTLVGAYDGDGAPTVMIDKDKWFGDRTYLWHFLQMSQVVWSECMCVGVCGAYG